MTGSNQHSRVEAIAREFSEIPFPDHEAKILAEAYLEKCGQDAYDRGWADGRKEGLEAGESERLQLRASFYEIQEARDGLVEQLEAAQTENQKWREGYAPELAELESIREQLQTALRERDEAQLGYGALNDRAQRAEEQLEAAKIDRDTLMGQYVEIEEQLQAAEGAAQRNWDEHVERQLKALDVDPERKARLAAERERDGLLDQYGTLRSLLTEITERDVNGLWSDQDLVDRVRAALNPAERSS